MGLQPMLSHGTNIRLQIRPLYCTMEKMKVLVGCERSGRVRDAFIEQGHQAVSVDIKPSKVGGPHIKGRVESYLDQGWDLAVFHPPCTYLCLSGQRWLDRERIELMHQSLQLFWTLWEAPIPKVAIENPPMHTLAYQRVPPKSQTVHPWWFGHAYTKRTNLWLRELPLLKPTQRVPPKKGLIHNMTTADRSYKRSITPTGMARAMARQWGHPAQQDPWPAWD